MGLLQASKQEKKAEPSKPSFQVSLVKNVPQGLKGWVYKVSRFQIRMNPRFLVLNPSEGTLSRFSSMEDYPLRPIEIIPLRCIFAIKKSQKRWYRSSSLSYF